ncbi:hypothetical protein HMPREF3169_05235 [Corynebacterium sp. HMSC08C04]|uniref:hypothetical protein n=1 Tax=Corynebacterium sp. HMSC08C04 TaxID=1581137 RepID=UPI0008A2980A|nr:hypothetical protein [Corynebacterium sp. HMSC08C04]OFT34647.1 hypothetical protein HMPREF3169_05235 [Corynebacterium sp. HMSC08C04]
MFWFRCSLGSDTETANLQLVEEETNRQLSEETVTGNSITNRATLLLTTAVIFVGVSKAGNALGAAETATAVFGLLASLCAVVTLFSGTKVGDTNLDKLDKHADQLNTYLLRGKILSGKRQTLTKRKDAHKAQMRWLRAGYAALLLAVLAATFPVVINLFEREDMPNNENEKPRPSITEMMATPPESTDKLFLNSAPDAEFKAVKH